MSLADLTAKPSTDQVEFGSHSDDGGGFHLASVSWPAVLAGAFVTAALSLVLLSLGAGLGLSSLSFWGNTGSRAAQVGMAAILWLIFNELVASAMGGYLAGRLRTKWLRTHADETYFRDTAHGLLVWSVAVVISVSFMTAAATSMVGSATVANAAAADARSNNSASHAYFVDMLFRSDPSGPKQPSAQIREEAERIVTYAVDQGNISAADEDYLGQVVSAQTGLDQVAAQKRVSAVISQAKQALEAARKASAHLLLWIFVALLVGAFSASLAATIGGRQRDHLKAI